MMKKSESSVRHATNRRAFLTNGMVAAGAATMGAALSGRMGRFANRGEQFHLTLRALQLPVSVHPPKVWSWASVLPLCVS